VSDPHAAAMTSPAHAVTVMTAAAAPPIHYAQASKSAVI
jgi:hypothetical protein